MLNTHMLRMARKHGAFNKTYLACNALLGALVAVMVVIVVKMPHKPNITQIKANTERSQ